MDIPTEFITEDHQPSQHVKPGLQQTIDNAPAILQSIISMRSVSTGQTDEVKTKVSGLRSRAVKDTALSLGAQAGLFYRNQQIQSILKNDESLDLRYNFAPFIEQDKVLMPSVVKGQAVEVFNGNSITTARVQYRIHEPARLVMNPPTYRSYLLHSYKKPEPPRDALKPRTKNEVYLWRAAAVQGWELGIRQANEMFESSLARLDRAIDGRLLYLKMRELGMISKVALKVEKSGVTFNGDTMSVGQVVYSITQDANYTQFDEWGTAIKAE